MRRIALPVPVPVQIEGERHEPYELVDIELPEEAAGSAIDLLNQRKGNMLDMSGANKAGMVTVQYEVPSRGMNGVKTRLLSATKARLHPLTMPHPLPRSPPPRRACAARVHHSLAHWPAFLLDLNLL